jgi:hypothetical protein
LRPGHGADYHFGVATPETGRGDARALLEQMKGRLDRGPFAALGIADGATPQAARTAFLELTKTYHPAKFAREAPEVVRQANEVFLSLRAAYDSIAQPRKQSQAIPAMTTAASRATPARGVPVMQPRSTAPLPREPATVRRPGSGEDAPTVQRRDREPPTIQSREPATIQSREPATERRAPPAVVTFTTPTASTTTRTAGSNRAPAAAKSPAPGSTARLPGAHSQPKPATGSAAEPAKPPTGPSPQPRPATGALPRSATGALPQLSPGVVAGSEEGDLEVAMHHLRRKQWTEARKLLHALAARVPTERSYRALLSYARGRENQDLGRHDDARTEFLRALQLDPELTAAKNALNQVADDPPERPSGGLFSRLFRK